MLNILADALLIATGHRPQPQRRDGREVDWNNRFLSSRLRGLDHQAGRFNATRDLDW